MAAGCHEPLSDVREKMPWFVPAKIDAVVRLLQAQDIAIAQPLAHLLPGLADVVGREQSPVDLVIDDAHVQPIGALRSAITAPTMRCENPRLEGW